MKLKKSAWEKAKGLVGKNKQEPKEIERVSIATSNIETFDPEEQRGRLAQREGTAP